MQNNRLQQNLKWEQRQRLTLLEATVFWSGEVSTHALLQRFGISRVQASKDLTLYQSLCPDNIRYDKFLKRYVINPCFKAAFMQGSAGEFLQVLQMPRATGSGAVLALAENLPAVEVMEPAFRQVRPEVLQIVNQAIVGSKEVQVLYQSMSRPEPALHRLHPHALVYDGLRWHARAYSYTHQAFRDFVLVRMLSAELVGDGEQDATDDAAWQAWVCVKIGPHPGLSPAQRQAVAFDYGMRDGLLQRETRGALVPYLLKTLRIGPDDFQRRAEVQQIVLLNRDELQGWLGF